jgi:hypothetical protein
VPCVLGCDLVQGFQDAGDALFPEQSTHLSSPSLRLVSGGFRGLSLAAGRELSVLARSVDSDTSLFVMRFAKPEPCEIPSVGRYVASTNPNRAEAGIAYFRDDVAQGTLRFADTSCRIFDFELEDARLPVGETDSHVIVWAAGQLLEVDPEAGERNVLAAEVSGLITRAFSGRTLVRTGGRLEVFGSDWKSQGSFGDGVGTVVRTNAGALYLDATGLRRLSRGPSDTSTQDELIAADACNLGMRDDTWATFLAPCASERLQALHEPSGKLYELGFAADARYLRLIPAQGSAANSPIDDPFWFLFLRDVASARGTFVLRDPQGIERIIGQDATLDHSVLIDSGTSNHGYALVNAADGLGDYVYFDSDGATKTLARNLTTGAERLVVNWDGSVGDLAVASGDRLEIVAQRVPQRGFEFTDASREWTVLFHDLQGASGRLSRFAGTLDGLGRTPRDAPFARPELEEVDPNVGAFTTTSFGKLIPGTIFLADYDLTTGTGKLAYENAELRFRALVDVGVSDYLFTSTSLLYAIPYGPARGIWLTSGK